jgi:hypothetical protein
MDKMVPPSLRRKLRPGLEYRWLWKPVLFYQKTVKTEKMIGFGIKFNF